MVKSSCTVLYCIVFPLYFCENDRYVYWCEHQRKYQLIANQRLIEKLIQHLPIHLCRKFGSQASLRPSGKFLLRVAFNYLGERFNKGQEMWNISNERTDRYLVWLKLNRNCCIKVEYPSTSQSPCYAIPYHSDLDARIEWRKVIVNTLQSLKYDGGGGGSGSKSSINNNSSSSSSSDSYSYNNMGKEPTFIAWIAVKWWKV